MTLSETYPITIHTDDKQFVICLPTILALEGGNSDDPHDRGGRTSRGITQREYDAYRRLRGLSERDVFLAGWDEIEDIYYFSYWLPTCPKLWIGANLMFFDQAVNQGPAQAARNLQRAINNFIDPGITYQFLRLVGLRKSYLKVDGVVGMQTLAAMNRLKGSIIFLKIYYEQDLNFYHSLRQWIRYGRGWRNRALTVYRQAMALAQPKGGSK